MTRRDRENRLARRLGAGAVVVVLLVVGGFWYLRQNKVDVQSGNFCPVSEPSPRTTLVLIDARAQLAARTAELLRAELDSGRLQVTRHERVVLVLLDRDGLTGVPVFDKCSPGTQEEANPAIENPKRLARHRAEDFVAPLIAAAKAASVPMGGDAPLIESLSDLSKRADLHFRGAGGARRLVIFSPFLQISPGMRQAQDCESSYVLYSRGQFAQSHPIDLKGIEVLPYMVALEGRDRDYQRASLRQFWEELLHAKLAGASEVAQSIKPLPKCSYPTLEDEARRLAKQAEAALAGCRIGEAQGHLKVALSYSAATVNALGLPTRIARRKIVCEEQARAREEERKRAARGEAASASNR